MSAFAQVLPVSTTVFALKIVKRASISTRHLHFDPNYEHFFSTDHTLFSETHLDGCFFSCFNSTIFNIIWSSLQAFPASRVPALRWHLPWTRTARSRHTLLGQQGPGRWGKTKHTKKCYLVKCIVRSVACYFGRALLVLKTCKTNINYNQVLRTCLCGRLWSCTVHEKNKAKIYQQHLFSVCEMWLLIHKFKKVHLSSALNTSRSCNIK